MTTEADQMIAWLKAELQDWFRANTNGGVLEPVGFWILMACFLAFTCLWTFWLLARFRLPTFKTR
jgi:hypothetical protein